MKRQKPRYRWHRPTQRWVIRTAHLDPETVTAYFRAGFPAVTGVRNPPVVGPVSDRIDNNRW